MPTEVLRATFRHAPVPGGGFVTGFLFHPACPGLLYARTDIGGVYRYEPDRRRWHSLCDGVSHLGRWETFPLSIATSRQDANLLYIAAGDWHTNRLCVSRDRGDTFTYHPIPAPIHGNAPGRGTGERLAVSPTDAATLYFASQSKGLLHTRDGGLHWDFLDVCGEQNLTLCFLHPQNPDVIVVGASGEANRSGENVRGPSLYLSTDGGATFAPMPGQPAPLIDARATHAGYVAQRAAFDGRYLYVTMNMPTVCWAGWASYACDTGTAFDGVLLRYAIGPDGQIGEVLDLTPAGFSDPQNSARRLGCGLSGISLDPARPGVLIVSTICNKAGDTLYLSCDHGRTLRPILHDLDIGHIDFTVPYMKPPYNGNHSIVHWMADVQINPHDGNMAVFTTGTGIFATFNLTAALHGECVSWQPLCDGLEETVHLNVYSPPTGRVKLLDIIGDLGGFAFEDLDTPCENSFADAQGNRYITCMNADYLDTAPAPVCVTARGNWTGKTTGGLILSDDDMRTWQRLAMPYGISPYLDGLLRTIETPNNNAGWVALSADGETILWSVADEFTLPIPALVRTRDRGRTWQACRVLDASGRQITDPAETLKVFSDRVNPSRFYGFAQHGMLYHSTDGGQTFTPIAAKMPLPDIDPTGIDGRQHYDIRATPAQSGVFYLSAAERGLYQLRFGPPEAAKCSVTRMTPAGEPVFRVGVGKDGALLVNACFSGEYGFYLSRDGGKTFWRAGNDGNLFGDIRSIAGDPRRANRFYIATGSRGVLYMDIMPA